MPETRDVEPVVQVPLDTDPDDVLVTGDDPLWPYDPTTESVPDEAPEGEEDQ